jgi:hypothetical protein
MSYDQPGGQQQWPPQQPYQQYPPPGGQPPYPGQGHGPQPRRPRKKHHRVRNIFAGIGAMVVVIVIIASLSGKSGSTPPAPGSSAAAPASPAAVQATHSAKAAAARTVRTFTGSGIQNTPKFTVTATWKLVYSFNCASFGQSGNFQVDEDGGSDFGGVSVNDLSMARSASTWAYNDGGTHYLAVNSECSWKLKVVDEP